MTTVRTDRRFRPRNHARFLTLAAICALAAVGAVPAQAGTGGASTVVATEAQTGGGLAFSSWRSAGATWYGPGLYGRHTACGQMLRPGTLGVAHRSLPCGTAVKFTFHGRQIVTRVIDRGPYSQGKFLGSDQQSRRSARLQQHRPGADPLRGRGRLRATLGP